MNSYLETWLWQWRCSVALHSFETNTLSDNDCGNRACHTHYYHPNGVLYWQNDRALRILGGRGKDDAQHITGCRATTIAFSVHDFTGLCEM